MDAELSCYFTKLADQRLATELATGLATPDGGSAVGHRQRMTMIMNAVCCFLNPASELYHDDQVGNAAAVWATAYGALQDPSGLFSSSGNISSVPDSGFSLNDACRTVLLLRSYDVLPGLRVRLQMIIDQATPALVSGGVHTPNHRWEVSVL